MLGRTYEKQICSVARALEIAGERWSLLILRNAMYAGITRFTDFQRGLDIAPNILASRLETFVQEGIMSTSKGESEHLEYHLTAKGLDFKPVIFALKEWGDRWAAPEGPPVVIEHDRCGGRIEQNLHCKTCRRTPKLLDMIAKPTKAMTTYEKKKSRRKQVE